MAILISEIKNSISPRIIRKTFVLTLFFLFGGMILFFSSLIVSYFIQTNVIKTIVQGIGIIFGLIAILAAFASVYNVTTNKLDNRSIKNSLTAVLRKIHYLFLIAFLLSVGIFVIVGIQYAISYFSLVQYIGPFVVALLTGIFYGINVFVALVYIAILAIVSPLILEVNSFFELLKKAIRICKKNWFEIISYILVSTSVLMLATGVIYYISRYAIGITTPIQWKINAAFPPTMQNILLNSFITDIIRRITPSPDPIGAFMEYGVEIFSYIDKIKMGITISYSIIVCIIISFIFAIYFSISSRYYERLKN